MWPFLTPKIQPFQKNKHRYFSLGYKSNLRRAINIYKTTHILLLRQYILISVLKFDINKISTVVSVLFPSQLNRNRAFKSICVWNTTLVHCDSDWNRTRFEFCSNLVVVCYPHHVCSMQRRWPSRLNYRYDFKKECSDMAHWKFIVQESIQHTSRIFLKKNNNLDLSNSLFAANIAGKQQNYF